MKVHKLWKILIDSSVLNLQPFIINVNFPAELFECAGSREERKIVLKDI